MAELNSVAWVGMPCLDTDEQNKKEEIARV
jgi:hypothetical protein